MSANVRLYRVTHVAAGNVQRTRFSLSSHHFEDVLCLRQQQRRGEEGNERDGIKEMRLICTEVGGQSVAGSPEQAPKEAALKEKDNLFCPADWKRVTATSETSDAAVGRGLTQRRATFTSRKSIFL
ncbi:hypothetical protein KOW79_008591 [Hemibagrus wyckioides]|uniref:Uncharacterized protein n=1 Tax=Hemibagrus wyckioides TaxID=337641 RepID=A0A9D3NUJ1_9TELE|nr:hypothetical protein KOW79_008591 [Hemibagrus wyckioides]